MIKGFFIFACLISLVLPLWSQQPDVILKASGATFPYPLYKKWMKVYQKQTGVRITYNAIGSSSGIKELFSQKVDFCGSDAFLSEGEMAGDSQEILHIPSCLGAVVVVSNLPGHPEIKLTPQLVSAIFLGEIKSWSDKRMSEANPGVRLPDLNINVVHRSDGSGTTFIFTNYLSKVSHRWKQDIGSGKSVKWPIGIGTDSNSGIVNFVRRIPGSIGYVELTYAKESGLPMASIQNQSGRFIKPTLESVSAAASVQLPADTRTVIVDTEAREGYPISGFTWILFYKEQNYNHRTLNRAVTLVKYLWWLIHEGQNFNKNSSYGQLPVEAVKKAELILRSMTYEQQPVITW